MQPIHVEDMAQLSFDQGKSRKNVIIDAIGPDTVSYKDFAKYLMKIMGMKKPIIIVPDFFGYIIGWIMGKILGDVPITKEEIDGLKADLLCTKSLPAGKISLIEWARENASTLGMDYASELARRRNRKKAYEDL